MFNAPFLRVQADILVRTCRAAPPSPAAIDDELGAAALVHPDPGAVPAPGPALDTGCLGVLPQQRHAAARADIDLAEVVLVLRAAAGDLEAPVPARSRLPAAAIGRRDAAAVEAPGPPLHAGSLRRLPDQLRTAPVARHGAAQHPVLRTAAGNDVVGVGGLTRATGITIAVGNLRARRGSGRERECREETGGAAHDTPLSCRGATSFRAVF